MIVIRKVMMSKGIEMMMFGAQFPPKNQIDISENRNVTTAIDGHFGWLPSPH